MKFNDFVSSIQILDKQRGNELRKQYIDCFIDNNQKSYHEQIERKHKFVDGYCYLGYLWDYLIDREIVSEEYIESISKKLGQVYVFWDIHSSERIFIKDYWRFDKDAMIKLDFDMLLAGLKHLPEDIYIFDDTLKWTIAYTHEEIADRKYCLKCGEI